VLGIKSLLCPRGKVDMIEKQLVRIEQENRNRLLPKIFLNDETLMSCSIHGGFVNC
jgi:hypothetical protein